MMSVRLLVMVGACLAYVFAHGEAVYRNGPSQGRASSLALYGVGEYADEITLAGTNRTITGINVFFIADVTLPQGDERIRVRFYNLDGPAVNGKVSPGSVIWDSGNVVCKYYWRSQRLAVPNVVVPNTFVWSIEAVGLQQISEDQIGPSQFGPPELGSSSAHYWRKVGGTWSWTSPGNAWERSLAMTLWAGGDPSTPYDNITNYLNSVVYSAVEYGDDVCFEGSARTISNIQLRVVGDLTNAQGDERVIVKVYPHATDDPYGSPSATPLWTSAPTPVLPGSNTITVSVPNVSMPDNIVYTVSFQGMAMAPGDRAGMELHSPPAIGASHILYWIRDGSWPPNGFFSDWFGDPTPSSVLPVANLGARFNAGAAPTVINPTSGGPPRPGSPISGTWMDVLASDDARWQLRPTAVAIATADPIVVIFNATAPGSSPSAMTAFVETSATASGIRQIVEARRFSDSTWTNLETYLPLPTGANDRVVTLPIPSPSQHIGPANAIQLRLKFKAMNAVAVFPWRARIDRVYWSYTP